MRITFLNEGYSVDTAYWYLTYTSGDRVNHYYWNGTEIKEAVSYGNGWKTNIFAKNNPFILLDQKDGKWYVFGIALYAPNLNIAYVRNNNVDSIIYDFDTIIKEDSNTTYTISFPTQSAPPLAYPQRLN